MSDRQATIGDRTVSTAERPLVVAEAGGNHNGDLEQMYRLIDVAVEAGADAVKIALSRAETQYPESAPPIDYFDTDETPYELIKRREVPFEWIPKIQSYCRERDILFFSSCCDFETADVLEDHGVPAFKIPSYEARHIPLLKHVAKKDKPIIISRGITPYEEVAEALETIREAGNDRIVLLHCTGSYPTHLPESNVSTIPDLREEFEVVVGMSDHTEDPRTVPTAATALGAAVVEKHFTLSNRLPGVDHPFAVEPDELSALVDAVHDTYAALGNPQMEVSPVEEDMTDLTTRSVFSTADIKSGEQFTRDNTWVLRAGGMEPGMHPRYWECLLGERAACDIQADTGLHPDDVVSFDSTVED
jgi:N-acetylneuraminate synthase